MKLVNILSYRQPNHCYILAANHSKFQNDEIILCFQTEVQALANSHAK